jgi:hypothetical protein
VKTNRLRNSLVVATILPIFSNTSFAQTASNQPIMFIPPTPNADIAGLQTSQPANSIIAVIDPKDLSDWRAAELADTRDGYTAYLAAHPNGWFKAVAQSEIEPGISASIGERPFANLANRNRQQMAQINDWEESVWRNAKSVGTHMALRGYFVRVRNGAHIQEAVRLLNATRPKLPDGIPIDCKTNELLPRKLVDFDLQRDFPDRAIQTGESGGASGYLVVDRTGLVFAFANAIYNNANIYGQFILQGIFRMRYEPMRAGCLVGQPIANFEVELRVGNAN